MSSSSTVPPSLALDANRPPAPSGSGTPSPSPRPEKSIHGSVHSRPRPSQLQPQHQHQRKDSENDDDEGHEDDGASVDRAFSVVSFSLHRPPSADSVFESKVASVPLASGYGKNLHPFRTRCGEKVGSQTSQTGPTDKENVSWWARIRGRSRKENVQEEFDEVDEKDIKALEADYIPDPDPEAVGGGGGGEDDYPDGGLEAWMVVFGGMLNTFSAFGFVNTWGIFQSYYQQTILKDLSPSTIAWIGSIQYALVFFPAILVGRLFDLGYFRSVFLACSLLLIVATFLVAECTVYWQFLLCQGIAVGLASAGIFGPTMAVIAHWFKKRRGLAMGLVATGSSLGGSLFPIAAKNLIAQVGFKWTMRLIGFILILTLGVSNFVMKRRLPPKNVPGGLLNLSAFQSLAYTIYCISAFTTYLGMYTVLTYIDVAAAGVPGVSETFSFYLVSIANASSFVGRYVSGVISDRTGPMNVMIPFTLVAGVVTCIWPYARMVHGLVAVAIVYGFSSGAYVSLLANPLMDMGDTNDVGRRIGMFMSILALGALGGPPISGAINKATGGYVAVGWYAGSMVLLGVVMMCTVRWLVLKRWIGRF